MPLMAPISVPIISTAVAPQPLVGQVPAWWFLDSTPLPTASLNYTDGADVFAGVVSPIAGATLSYTDGADVFAGVVSPIAEASLNYTDGADVFVGAMNIYNVLLSMNVTDGTDIWSAAWGWSIIDNSQTPNWVIIPDL